MQVNSTNYQTSPSVIGTEVVLSALDQARIQFGQALGKTGDLQRHYAQLMNEYFGAEWWLLKGKESEHVKKEHEKFVSMMESVGMTRANIDKIWSRVKDDAGRVKSSAGRVSANVSVDEKTKKELVTILNRLGDTPRDEAPYSFKTIEMLVLAAEILGADVKAFRTMFDLTN